MPCAFPLLLPPGPPGNGQENRHIFSGDQIYTPGPDTTRINDEAVALRALVLADAQGGQSTYYKLRDLGQAIGFTVDWSAGEDIFIVSDKACTDAV